MAMALVGIMVLSTLLTLFVVTAARQARRVGPGDPADVAQPGSEMGAGPLTR